MSHSRNGISISYKSFVPRRLEEKMMQNQLFQLDEHISKLIMSFKLGEYLPIIGIFLPIRSERGPNIRGPTAYPYQLDDTLVSRPFVVTEFRYHTNRNMVTINTTVVRGTWKSSASWVLEPDKTPADTLTTKGSVLRTSEMNNFLFVDQLCGFAASRGSHSTRSLSNSMLAAVKRSCEKRITQVRK